MNNVCIDTSTGKVFRKIDDNLVYYKENYVLDEIALGGRVGYIYYDDNIQHGLIYDLGVIVNNKRLFGADGLTLDTLECYGCGITNTEEIITKDPGPWIDHPAADLPTGWYLPSFYELYDIYNNRANLTFPTLSGDDQTYFTSTARNSDNTVIFLNFDGSAPVFDYGNRTDFKYVMVIKYF